MSDRIQAYEDAQIRTNVGVSLAREVLAAVQGDDESAIGLHSVEQVRALRQQLHELVDRFCDRLAKQYRHD